MRPVVSAREAAALREALALRQLLAARPELTPQQAAALLARTSAARAAAARTAKSGRPSTRTGRSRTKATRGRPARRTRAGSRRTEQTPRNGFGWPRRIGLAAAAAVLVPAVVSLSFGPSSPQPDATPTDATSLALVAQTTLIEHAGQYRQVQDELAVRRGELEQARTAEQAALAAVDERQDVVGAAAASLYRAAPSTRLPLLGIDDQDPDAVLLQQALAVRAADVLAGDVARAERTVAALAAARARLAAAEAAVAEVTERAAGILGDMRGTVAGLTPEIAGQLATLGTIPAAGPQHARNQAAVQRWQQYLAGLAAGGIVPPAAADLADPESLPPGLSPALDANGVPVPGVAWAIVGNRPVTVLPAETVAAVSSALSQLGKPYVPQTSGPDAYDCGGFTAASWLLAGYAVPATPRDQWATGTAVPTDQLQVGDLVISPGGDDVGIYLGDGDVLGASAAGYQVGVRSVMAQSTAVRVTLGPAATPNAPVTTVAPQGACGAPLPTPGPVTPAWGGWANGQIDVSVLCALGVGRHALRCDAAAAYAQMSAAYEQEFGHRICITDSYRSLASQRSAFARKPALAAVPGTSNHGWALAVDLCDGVNRAGSPQFEWMTAHAGRFGWVQPEWARPGGEKPEPWHWEFGYIS